MLPLIVTLYALSAAGPLAALLRNVWVERESAPDRPAPMTDDVEADLRGITERFGASVRYEGKVELFLVGSGVFLAAGASILAVLLL